MDAFGNGDFGMRLKWNIRKSRFRRIYFILKYTLQLGYFCPSICHYIINSNKINN